jgi:hypothetical protein
MNDFVIRINLRSGAVINCTSFNAFLHVFVFLGGWRGGGGRLKGGVNKDREIWRMDSEVM